MTIGRGEMIGANPRGWFKGLDRPIQVDRSQETMQADPIRDQGLKNLWRFMAFSVPYWPWLAVGMVTGLVRMILPLYMPRFVKNVIDQVLTAHGLAIAQRVHNLKAMLPLFVVIITIHVVATIGRIYWSQIAATNAIRDIRQSLFGHLQSLSLAFHNARPSGAIVSRVMNDVATAQTVFDLVLIQATQQALIAAVIAAYLIVQDWEWALVSFATVPLFLITTRAVRRPMRRASRDTLEGMSRMSGIVNERISMIREVQSFTAERKENRQIHREAELLKKYTLRQQFLNALLVASSDITRNTAMVIMLCFGVYRVLSGHATIGDVTGFYLYLVMFFAPVEFMSNLYANLHISAAAADRIFELLDMTPAIQDRPGAARLQPRRPPLVRFENVSFSYPADNAEQVLHDVSVAIQPGWRVVLVGGSGSGKSTLMSLLSRFYDMQGGRITIDGVDIRNVTVQSLRQAVGIVSQEPLLFTGTIWENILYGKRAVSEKQIRAAARAANAEQFILDLPDGYNTEVGERGVGLSGGQIQRIAIARAFLKDPPILILDEATSNLDATSESAVLDALDRLAAGRTTFIIAHRLSVARDADLIISLDHGRIAEMGTHRELLARDGLYSQLWECQMIGAAA